MTHGRTPKLLTDLIRHADEICETRARHGSDDSFLASRESMQSVLYNFIILGEIARRLGEPFHDTYTDIPWRSIIAQRDIIAHGYDVIDWPQLLVTIERDLPGMIAAARELLDQFGPPPT